MNARLALIVLLVLPPVEAYGEDTRSLRKSLGDEALAATDFCANFADQANEARVAWQNEELKKLESEIEGKIAELDGRRAALQAWVERREAMLNAAGKELVEIYAKMDAESASAQLAQLDTEVATSILRQLSPRVASAILGGMDSKRAAVLAKAIATAMSEPGKAGGS